MQTRKRTNAYQRLLLVSLAGILTLGSASAQERFGALNGVAKDAISGVLPGTTVTVTNKATSRAFTTTTGADGSYVARELEPGRYSVKFQLKGFATFENPDVLLLVGQNLKVDANMQVGSTEQTVQVTESSPLIDTSGTAISHNVTLEEFDRLPKTRTFQALALLSPSVNAGEIEGGIQVNGASGAENQFNIDGVSTTSLINGKSRQGAMFEILQEVQVKTGGIDAEYGGALGGVISAVTRSGGNQFHGDLHYYYFGNGINAGPVNRLLLDPQTEKVASYVQDSKFKDNNSEVGGSLGGPLVKNKLFFFSAFSPRFRRRSNDYKFSSGRESGSIAQEQTYHTLFNKISYDPVSRVRTNFTWLWSPTKSKGSLPGYNDVADTITSPLSANLVRKDIGFFSPQSSYTGQVDVTVTSTAMLTLRGGRFWDNFKDTGIPSFSAVEYTTSATSLTNIPANLRQPIGFNNTPRLINTFHDLATRTYFQADFSKFGNFLGQHNIKLGTGVSKTVNNVDTAYPGKGFVQVYWGATFTSPTLGRNTGTYGYYAVNDRGTRGTTGGTIRNIYIQDQWRILPRLTVTLGMRTETEKIPTFRRDIRDNAFDFGFDDKIAPRLGASYDVFGNGKLKVYGSFGRYFDWVKYELSRGTFGGDFWTIAYRTLDTTDVFSLSGTNLPGRNIWGAAPGAVRDRRVPAFDLVGKGIKPMSSDNMNFGTEYQLAPQMVFRANYVHNKLRRTIEDLGALDAKGDEVYLYANPGEGDAKINPTSGATKPFPMPKPIRTYDAMELSITRRFSKSLFGSASYVYSRLYGNYAGLASSDEITSPSTGLSSAQAQQQGGNIARQGGSANRAWDLDEILFDSRGNLDVKGRLATDRPHVVKLYGAYDFKFGTQVGAFFYGGSGTPISTYVNTLHQIPIFVEGRGNMGRTPILTQTDLVVSHSVRIAEGKSLKFEFNAINLFNQKTARSLFNHLNKGAGAARASSSIDLSNVDLFKGYDYRALINRTPDGANAYDVRYGKPDIFNTGFQGRMGVKFIF
jgi:hypothetical protein